MARSEMARSEGAESQLNRKSIAFTPRQNECLVNVRAPQPLPNLLSPARCRDAFDVRQAAASRARMLFLARSRPSWYQRPLVVYAFRQHAHFRCKGCYRRQIGVRLSYHGNQGFNERSGRSSRSDSPQTWPPDRRPTRRKGGGGTYCVDATKHARTESEYCR